MYTKRGLVKLIISDIHQHLGCSCKTPKLPSEIANVKTGSFNLGAGIHFTVHTTFVKEESRENQNYTGHQMYHSRKCNLLEKSSLSEKIPAMGTFIFLP